jgi:hypothetical protein
VLLHKPPDEAVLVVVLVTKDVDARLHKAEQHAQHTQQLLLEQHTLCQLTHHRQQLLLTTHSMLVRSMVMVTNVQVLVQKDDVLELREAVVKKLRASMSTAPLQQRYLNTVSPIQVLTQYASYRLVVLRRLERTCVLLKLKMIS